MRGVAGELPCRKELGVLGLGQHVSVSPVCPGSPEGKLPLGCIKHSMSSWAKEGIIPLYLELVQPHLAQCCAVLGLTI